MHRGLRPALALLALGAIGCAPASPGAAPPRSARSAVPPSRAARTEDRQHIALGLPVEGTWVVGQAYHGSESHRGYAAFALDLVKLDPRGRAYAREGKRTSDWFGFGADAVATADGEVVRAVGGFPDNPILGAATDANTLILKHARAEFSEYVHLQRGSLRVRVGERVRRGQVLARAGNSGAQTPHLHWALLSSIDPIRTRPAVFSDYEVQDAHGAWRPGSGTPRSGDVIRQRAPAPPAQARLGRPSSTR
jgi:murein DD-endopeptidase MepM/ murein hydrolase activator NlpD